MSGPRELDFFLDAGNWDQAWEWDLGYWGWEINRKGLRARGSLAPSAGATDSGREHR